MHHTYHHKGFTIIELLVSISIMSVLLSLVLFNYRTFSNRLAVSNASQEAGATIRQTQAYRLSVQEVTPGSGDFTTPYGVYFKKPDPFNPGTSYIVFADKDGDGLYDGSRVACNANTECLQKVDIPEGVALGYVKGSGGATCDPAYNDAMTIIFSRAVLDAEVSLLNNNQTKKQCDSATLAVYKKDPMTGAVLSEVSFDKTGQMTISEPKSCGTPTTVNDPGTRVCSGFESGDTAGVRCTVIPPSTYTTWSLCPGLITR